MGARAAGRANRPGPRRRVQDGPAVRVGAAFPPLPPAVRTLVLASLLMLFTVSGSLLWSIGYNYDGMSGSALTKIHPGTYLVVLTFGLAALAEGNPVRALALVAARRPASLFLFGAAGVVLAQTVYRSAPGMAGIVDTFMLPAVVSATVAMTDRPTRDRAELLLHGVMVANAVMALVEFGTKHLFFPYVFDGEEVPNDTRSTALQGHPLINATLTAVYVLALLSGGGRMGSSPRIAMVLLQAMALVAFGGRSALVVCTALSVLTGLAAAVRAFRSGRVWLPAVSLVVLALTIAPVVLAGLSLGGFFYDIGQRFESDGGSANTRVEMFELLRRIPLRDLVVGPDPGWVDSLRRVSGLRLGIENPVVKTVLYQGIALTALLIFAVGWFCREIVVNTRRGTMLPLLAFIVIINTFESVGTKATLLAKFAALMLILFRTDGTDGPGDRSPPGHLRPSSPEAVEAPRSDRKRVAT